MTIWFSRPGAPIAQGWTKRFAAIDWTVDFPRGAMAGSVVHVDQARRRSPVTGDDRTIEGAGHHSGRTGN